MNLSATLRKSIVNSPPVAATVYAALAIALVVVIISSVADILSQRASVAATAAMLEQLEGRKAPAAGGRSDAGVPSGSAFLEGTTVTVANCEMDQSALQSLLYDLEAGMPFLFVDQLDIQVAAVGEGRLRFLLGVSGQWRGAK